MKINKRFILEITLIILSGLAIFFITQHNERWYQQPLAQVMTVKNSQPETTEDEFKNKDQQTHQKLTFKMLNGKHRGQVYPGTNTFSYSGGNDQQFYKGQKVFVNLEKHQNKIYVTISNYKRDTYLLMLIWALIAMTYLVARFKGMLALLSVGLNFIIFLLCVQIDVHYNIDNIFGLFSMSALVFLALSLALVIGINKQWLVTFSSIFIGTSAAMIIGIIALALTNNQGIHYEALDFATQSPKQLFMSATVIGLLGAVMDAATDIVSTLFELKRTDPNISRKQLFKSGQAVGKSIMGPLINVLLLIFFTEALAMAVLFFRTGNTLNYTFEWTMSLGVVQALISGIGITLVIPSASAFSALILGGEGK